MSDSDAKAWPEGGQLRLSLLVVWPAFLAACLLEALVFSMVDPSEVHWFGHFAQPSRQAVYSIAFFSFWVIGMACSGLVLWLSSPRPALNLPLQKSIRQK